MTDVEELPGQVVRQVETGAKYVAEEIRDGDLIVAQLGDRLLDECPVEYGDECTDPDCDGRIGENERDPETLSAHELYCYGCGLNWVEHGGTWKETYADWPTSFTFEESRNNRSEDTETDRNV